MEEEEEKEEEEAPTSGVTNSSMRTKSSKSMTCLLMLLLLLFLLFFVLLLFFFVFYFFFFLCLNSCIFLTLYNLIQGSGASVALLETAESFSVTNCNKCKRHNKKQEQKDESKKPRCNVELEVHSRGLFEQKGSST